MLPILPDPMIPILIEDGLGVPWANTAMGKVENVRAIARMQKEAYRANVDENWLLITDFLSLAIDSI